MASGDESPVEGPEADADGESIIPSAVGAATAAANTQVGKALLLPAATALGNYWGERTEAKVAEWKHKRQRNAEIHVERVKAKGQPSAAFTEKRARLQEAWLDAAQHVDPLDDPELSAIWEGLLTGIMSGDNDSEELLEASKLLRASDAKFMTSDAFSIWPSRANFVTIKRLSQALLIKRATPLDNAGIFVLALTPICVILLASIDWLFPELIGLHETGSLIRNIITGYLGIALIVLMSVSFPIFLWI